MSFKTSILDNLARFKGIVGNPDRVEDIDNLLHEVNDKGFNRLVNNFCVQNDSNKAYDILFEIWICKMLLLNPGIRNLQYEPSDEARPPDFRFHLGATQFDMQIKRLQNIHNEIAKDSFHDECVKRLERIPKAWFIHYGVSKEFTRQDINPFFEHIKKNLDSFEAVPSIDKVPLSPRYCWPDKQNTLVSFAFSEKQKKENKFIYPGMIFDDVDGLNVHWVDMAPIRKSVRRVLNKAKGTLRKRISPAQSNLVVIKMGADIWIDDDDMLNILYGDEGFGISTRRDGSEDARILRSPNGLFRNNAFSTICGLILIPQTTTIFAREINGSYFLNPSHVENIKKHPKPFSTVPFHCPSTWKSN